MFCKEEFFRSNLAVATEKFRSFTLQFDELLDQSRKYPLVFAVALHPFVIGQPHRLRAFRDAVRHVMAQRDMLWITTPGEIARYCETLPKGTVPGS